MMKSLFQVSPTFNMVKYIDDRLISFTAVILASAAAMVSLELLSLYIKQSGAPIWVLLRRP